MEDKVLKQFADDSTEPDFYLSEGQRRALIDFVDGRSEQLGLKYLGDGYVKATLHGAEGEVLETHLIQAHYGQ
jgi:hypothetical protein